MGIIVNSISFQNYRQYGTGVLSFPTTEDCMLSVLVAQNGTGKTTLLNAITWCLYGRELHLSDEKKALPIVTADVVQNAAVGEEIPFSVTLLISDDEHFIEFSRKGSCKVTTGPTGNNRVIPGFNQLTVTITSKKDFENTIVKTGADADVIVKEYFDADIDDFYFFDGEKLRDFFSIKQSASIKQSIFNLSQINLLNSACDHLKKLNSDRTKILSKGSPGLAKLAAAQDKEEKRRALAVQTKEQNEELVVSLSESIAEVSDTLRNYEPVKHLQEERDSLEKKLVTIEAEEAELHSDRTSFIRRYTILLHLFPRIQATLGVIHEKEDAGDLPPAIDKSLIQKLIDAPDKPCPICNSSLDDAAKEHLHKLLLSFSVSSATSNYLKEIKGPLELAIEEIADFPKRLDKIRQTEMDLSARKSEAEARLTEITKSLSNYDGMTDEVNIAALEGKRTSLLKELNMANQSIGIATATISACDKELDNIAAEEKLVIKKMKEAEALSDQITVLDMLFSHITRIRASIIEQMKAEIEATTWKFFDQMIWKKNTFGKLSISDNYDVSVFNREGIEMTGSLSATEQMALAYAFTLAIHNASGKNCPLVIDSPLGRVSDTNRENMADALLGISKNKQIIMLFTPDEYSEEVRKIYEGHASVRILTLSDDEKYVEGIDH